VRQGGSTSGFPRSIASTIRYSSCPRRSGWPPLDHDTEVVDQVGQEVDRTGQRAEDRSLQPRGGTKHGKADGHRAHTGRSRGLDEAVRVTVILRCLSALPMGGCG